MRAIRTISWVLTFVALGAAAAAWFTPRSDVDADLAGDVALHALSDAGIDDAEVVGTPTLGVYSATLPDDESGPEIPAWNVVVALGDDEIEMKVSDEDGQLLFVDDLIGADRSERALTDDQWAEVEVYRDDHRDRWVTRNIAGSVAAAAIVGVGFVLARRTGDLR